MQFVKSLMNDICNLHMTICNALLLTGVVAQENCPRVFLRNPPQSSRKTVFFQYVPNCLVELNTSRGGKTLFWVKVKVTQKLTSFDYAPITQSVKGFLRQRDSLRYCLVETAPEAVEDRCLSRKTQYHGNGIS